MIRIFGVVFSVEDKNVLSNRQMDRASKSSLPDLLPKSTGCVGLGMQDGALQGPFDVLPVECNVESLTYSIFPRGVQCRVGALERAVVHWYL